MVPTSRHAGDSPSDPVSVAELLRRNVPAQQPAAGTAEPVIGDGAGRSGSSGSTDSGVHPIPLPVRRRAAERAGTDADVFADPRPSQILSVGSLLRREGRAPHTLDRPVQPRPGQLGEPERPHAARRAAVAAGAVIATGSVIAAALTAPGADGGSQAQGALDGFYPGFGLNDGSTGVLDGEFHNGLDAGLAAPTSWIDVAFPTALTQSATRQAATTTSSTAAPAATAPATASNLLAPLLPGSTTAAGSQGAAAGQAPSGMLGAVGGVVGVVGGVVEGASPVVGGLSQTLGAVTTPVVDGVVAPLTTTVAPVLDAVKPVVTPIANVLEPVTTPVLSALAPLTKPLLTATAPVTDPVLGAAAPVTGLLDTSGALSAGGATPTQQQAGSPRTTAAASSPTTTPTARSTSAQPTAEQTGTGQPPTTRQSAPRQTADETGTEQDEASWDEPSTEQAGPAQQPETSRPKSVLESTADGVGQVLSTVTAPLGQVTGAVGGLLGGR